MIKNRLMYLVKGELLRLVKYKVVHISLLLVLLWSVILFFVDANIFDAILPMIVLIDATMMSMMYIGSVMFFEKKESTMSSMLVTPSTNSELILSKVFANTIHNFFSSALIIAAFIIIKHIEINYFLMILSIILVTLFHTMLGLFLSYYQKDFTSLLMTVMIFSFVLLIPTVLVMVDILKGEAWDYILLISPVNAANVIISNSFLPNQMDWQYYISLTYLVVLGILLYRYLVLPKFKDYAISISGV